MIENLPERFLYERIPEGILELDERGLIAAVCGGFQDRLDDLRSYTRKLELLFQTSGLPETGNNVVLVDLQSDQGKTYTRSLDLQADTPADGTAALTTWVSDQLGVDSADLTNPRYGRDLLRLVDASTLDYLAGTIGAILYRSQALSDTEQTESATRILQTYFPRLKLKGTADSFMMLGRILGFDDVRVTPLFARLNAHKPNDIGAPDNDGDFSPEPDYQPQQEISPFYDPHKTNDGPFFTWAGTVANGTAATNFYTQVVNGANPWIDVLILDVEHGTVAHPANGFYQLGSSGTDSVGGPHKKAYVQPDGAGVMFRAVAEGAYFNDLQVQVLSSGTDKVITIFDRLSAIKYRSSFFDLAVALDFDRAEELYGTSAVKRNKDLAANPTLTEDGTAVSPYRPWTAGSVSTGLVYSDFLVQTDDNAPMTIIPRVQASGTNRQLNVDGIVAGGVQVAQALEEVRPATRFPRRSGVGFLIRDEVAYAPYCTRSTLFVTNVGTNSYAGTPTEHPLPGYTAAIFVQEGTNTPEYELGAEQGAGNTIVYRDSAGSIEGSYDFDSNSYAFTFPLASTPGWQVIAEWTTTDTEVVRPNPDCLGATHTTEFTQTVGSGTNSTGLNYTDFLHWDAPGPGVGGGYVDCIGVDQSGRVLFDILALNDGLYVDLVGSPGVSDHFYGTLVSKNAFRLYSDRTYKLSYDIAGNQRGFAGPESVLIRVSNGTSVAQDLVRSINPVQAFTTYEDTITGADGSFKIQFSQNAFTNFNAGSILDNIELKDDTAGTTVFADDFDDSPTFFTLRTVGTVATSGSIAYQPRPEDDVSEGFVDEVADDYPWRRDIVLGGEVVDMTHYNPIVDEGAVDSVDPVMAVPGHDGADYNVYGVKSTSGQLRLMFEARSTDDYKAGQAAVAYQGSLKSIATLSEADVALVNSKTDLETYFESGTKLFYAGLVNGVLVADPERFNSKAHRDGLVGWFPFNEHVDDDLVGHDHSCAAGNLTLLNVVPGDRLWDDTRGWYLKLREDTVGVSDKSRFDGDEGALSFWLKDMGVYGEGSATLLEFGPISFVYNGETRSLDVFVKTDGVAAPVGWIFPVGLTFVSLSKTSTRVLIGLGNDSGVITKMEFVGTFDSFVDSTLTIHGTKTNNLGISDLRIWNRAKTAEEFEQVRYHQPVETKTNHSVGFFYTLNRTDRYALKVLPSGYVTSAQLPGVVRQPRLGRVQRYDSLGRYSGESRFKETGVGGGQFLPVTTKLGQQFYDLTAEGHAVVSTGHGALPGDSADWNLENAPGSFLRLRYQEAAFVPRGTTWKYLDDGSNQGTAWKEPGFDDGAWAAGPAPLGYGDPVATTVSFGSNASNKFVTTYFRKTFVLPDPENYGDLYISLRRDDGAIVYLNGTEVIRSNLRDVAINSLSLAYTSQAGTQETNYYPYTISNTVLQEGTNVLAAEVHQVDVTSSDIIFDLCFCGTRSVETVVSTGTASPWPNGLLAFNPNRDRAWIEGDDEHIYEIKLVSDGSVSAKLEGEFIARARSAAEIILGQSGTYSEQPTGVMVEVSGSNKMLSVAVDGSTVYQVSDGTRTTPPLFMYLNSRTIEDVLDAHSRWTEQSESLAFGNQQAPAVAALDANGVLEFTNNSTITPGNYRLTIESGNIGKVDTDFDGFVVEIAVDATLLQKRLLQGQTGYNFRGTDVFEFGIENGVSGEWLLSVSWTNAFNDNARGTQRQLAVYSYKLERIATELYRVEPAPSGSIPLVTQLNTSSFNPSTSGGWLVGLTSYGTIGSWQHESTVYPSNDTVASKLPMSDLLTATTMERREDILGPINVILADGTDAVLPSFGTIAEATALTPDWLWSGAVTGESVVISARMPADSALIQAVVSTTGSLTDPLYSDYFIANTDNGRVAKIKVNGLEPNTQYYYGIATDGTIAPGLVGKFHTWDKDMLNFTFALASCVDNRLAITTDPPVFDIIRGHDPLFFLHMGDLHYNDDTAETISVDGWQHAVDDLFSKSPRQRQFYREMPVIYMWDDHDFGPGDGGRDFTRVPEVQRGFRRVVPHYNLVLGADEGPVAYTFSVGRCFFIATDLRSENTGASAVDDAEKTHMGERQKAWFKQQLLYAKEHYPVIFWVNTIPWPGAFFRNVDNWAGFTTERTEIAEFATANGIQGLFILSGDMHALAADDGTHSEGRFPCFQCAPLFRDPSIKGGPYTVGPFPSAGTSAYAQNYGLISISDDGSNSPTLTFVGRSFTTGTDTVLCTVVLSAADSPKP